MSDRTLGDEILAAHRAVGEAIERRNALIADALDKGATVRLIGALIDVPFTTVQRWGGGPRGRAKGVRVLGEAEGGTER